MFVSFSSHKDLWTIGTLFHPTLWWNLLLPTRLKIDCMSTYLEPFTPWDITQLDKVQRRFARFAKTTTNGPSQSHNSPLNSVGNHSINAEGMLAWLCSTKVSTVQIQFQFIIYSCPRDIPDIVEPIHLPCFPHALTSINTRTSPELLSTGMLFLTQPVQHHLLIPSVQHSTDYPPLHPTPTASSMTLRQ